jgi:hypothetical protein
MHLLFEDTLIKVLQQDGNEQIKQDLLSDYHQRYKEQNSSEGANRAIIVVEDGGDAIIGQHDEDRGEGVHEAVEVVLWWRPISEVYLVVLREFGPIREELQAQKRVGHDEEEEKDRESRDVDQGTSQSLNKNLESFPRTSQFEDSHQSETSESCDDAPGV